MTKKQFLALKLNRGDIREFKDNAALRQPCYRLLRFRNFTEDGKAFHADWMTRHDQPAYSDPEWGRDGVFDFKDLEPIEDLTVALNFIKRTGGSESLGISPG